MLGMDVGSRSAEPLHGGRLRASRARPVRGPVLENSDLPMIQGVVVFATLWFLVFNLFVDISTPSSTENPPELIAQSRGRRPPDLLHDGRRDRGGGLRRSFTVEGGQDARDRRYPAPGRASRASRSWASIPRSPPWREPALFRGEDLLQASNSHLHEIRGNDIAMIFQDPMTSLNPVHKVGAQLVEADPAPQGRLAEGSQGARARGC